MKKTPAFIAALISTFLVGVAMLAIAVNAIFSPTPVKAAPSDPEQVTVSGDAQAQLQQMQSLIAQYQAREKQYQGQVTQLSQQLNQANQQLQQAASQLQQYQAFFQQLQEGQLNGGRRSQNVFPREQGDH